MTNPVRKTLYLNTVICIIFLIFLSSCGNDSAIDTADTATPAAGTYEYHSNRVYPQWWGAKGDGIADDTKAVQEAINTIASEGGGDVIFVKGTYLVNSLVLDSNVNLVGEGWSSTIRQKTGANYGCSINPDANGTPNVYDNKHSIKIINLQFRGTVDIDGFAEHIHLLNINAATDVIISNCKFAGWRGDGIYIGSSNTMKTERHNKNITIKDNVFDGLNKDNRNAISIIDGDNVTIHNNSFMNCTRPNMPGAIDMEPNPNDFAVIRDIHITNNKFNNIGGSDAIITLFLPTKQQDLKTPSRNIVIRGNIVDGDKHSIGIMLKQLQEAIDTTEPNNIIVSKNTVMHTSRPFVFGGIKGIEVENNTFEDSSYPAVLSDKGKYKSQDVEFKGNIFKKLGSAGGIGIELFGEDRISFINNVFFESLPKRVHLK